MKRRTGWILGGLAFGMLFSQTAAAAQIHFTGEACPLLITADLEGTVPYAGAVAQNSAPEEGEPETEAAAAELADRVINEFIPAFQELEKSIEEKYRDVLKELV